MSYDRCLRDRVVCDLFNVAASEEELKALKEGIDIEKKDLRDEQLLPECQREIDKLDSALSSGRVERTLIGGPNPGMNGDLALKVRDKAGDMEVKTHPQVLTAGKEPDDSPVEWTDLLKVDLTTKDEEPTEKQEWEIERDRAWDWAVNVCLENMPEWDRKQWIREQRQEDALELMFCPHMLDLRRGEHFGTDGEASERGWAPLKFFKPSPTHIETPGNVSDQRKIDSKTPVILKRDINDSKLLDWRKVCVSELFIISYDASFQLTKARPNGCAGVVHDIVILDDDDSDEEMPPLLDIDDNAHVIFKSKIAGKRKKATTITFSKASGATSASSSASRVTGGVLREKTSIGRDGATRQERSIVPITLGKDQHTPRVYPDISRARAPIYEPYSAHGDGEGYAEDDEEGGRAWRPSVGVELTLFGEKLISCRRMILFSNGLKITEIPTLLSFCEAKGAATRLTRLALDVLWLPRGGLTTVVPLALVARNYSVLAAS
ncbi:hypothetical protein K438DRAFT_1773158 [Mycena galopus ATCC 62051]|nr:hypothetical protein K438DRAFT_1773158 [Mycena galopus ATCC 62051]